MPREGDRAEVPPAHASRAVTETSQRHRDRDVLVRQEPPGALDSERAVGQTREFPRRPRPVPQGGGGGGADDVRRVQSHQERRWVRHRHSRLVRGHRDQGQGAQPSHAPPSNSAESPTHCRISRIIRVVVTHADRRPDPSSTPQEIVANARAEAAHTKDEAGRSSLLLHAKRDLYLLAFDGVVDHLRRSPTPDAGAVAEAVRDTFDDVCDDWRELVEHGRREAVDLARAASHARQAREAAEASR